MLICSSYIEWFVDLLSVIIVHLFKAEEAGPGEKIKAYCTEMYIVCAQQVWF